MSVSFTVTLFCDICGWWESELQRTFSLPTARTQAVRDSVAAHRAHGWNVSNTGKVSLCPQHTEKSKK